MFERTKTAALSLTAVGLVTIALNESYTPVAAPPVKGDAPTYGFGSTGPDVHNGDKITPPKALERVLRDVQKDESAVNACVHVPLAQNEYDAYIDLAYNIGPAAFCGSTLVRRLNAGDYAGACREILKWDQFKGKPLAGLTKRRQQEYHTCIGDQNANLASN